MVFGMALAAAGLVDDGVAWRRLIADYRTDVGQQRTVALDDSTSLLLNTRTAIDVSEDGAALRIRLLQGEILLRQQLGGRPVQIQTSQGEISSVGGQVVVARNKGSTTVNVISGAATVAIEGRGRQALKAGERLVFDARQSQPIDAISDQEIAWVDGQIIARDMKLADFIEELQRYSTDRLVCDPAVASMPVTGRFPLSDVHQVMRWLGSSLPLRVETEATHWGRSSLMIRAVG